VKKIVLEDLMGLGAYEKVRDKLRQEIIEYKKTRRLAVGNRVSLIFEDKNTMLFQIQEILRAERITDLDKIREEIDVYNELIPDAGELSATLLIEIVDQDRIRADLLKFLGIDEAVYLKVGDKHTIRAIFEPGRSKEDKISAVQYLRFPISPETRESFLHGTDRASVRIDHPNYQAESEILPAIRNSLAQDLKD
jgi:Protein of unknown function (DUF3501)